MRLSKKNNETVETITVTEFNSFPASVPVTPRISFKNNTSLLFKFKFSNYLSQRKIILKLPYNIVKNFY